MNIGQRIEAMGRQLLALVIITAVLALGGIVTSFSAAADGEAYGYTRIALGLLGLVGAVLIVVGNDFGKMGLTVVIAWAAIQSVFYATVPDGNFTRQLFDGLMGITSQTTINGEVSNYSAIGINMVGAAMLIFAYVSRNQPMRWQNRSSQEATV